MKQVTAFLCEHCHKVYLRAHACKKHEQFRCTQNPEIRPLCYSCEYYAQSGFEDKADDIEFEFWTDYYGDQHSSSKEFSPNKCSHPSNGGKLYNNMKLSAKMTEALSNYGYKPMPTLRTGGCQFYKAIPNHHYAIKTES